MTRSSSRQHIRTRSKQSTRAFDIARAIAKEKQITSPYLKTIALKKSLPKLKHNKTLDIKQEISGNFLTADYLPEVSQERNNKIILPSQRIRINRKDLINTNNFEGQEFYALSQILQFQDDSLSKVDKEEDPKLKGQSSLEIITQRSTHSRSLSRHDLSINNYDKSINEINRIPPKPSSWRKHLDQEEGKSPQGEERTFNDQVVKIKKPYNANQEFSENVMHIIDRSHLKYKLNIDDDFTIESQIAKKKIKTEQKLMTLMGPNKYLEYSQDKRKKQILNKRAKSNLGVFPIKKPGQRNELFHKELYDRAQSRRRGYRINFNEKDQEYQEALKNQHAKKYFLSAEEMKEDRVRKDDYFLPDIKDYHRIIERGLEKLKQENYDDWSMLVKMCFDDPYKKQEKPFQVFVGSVELMRFHPFFNKLSYYAVKDFLQGCKLVKLRPNQLLYRQDDQSPSVYVIMFGKIILHHRVLGALGVLGMNHTVGEETLIESKLNKKQGYLKVQQN